MVRIVTQKSYPLVMILDADYYFTMVQSSVGILADHDELDPAVLVGIAYPGVAEEKHGPIYKVNRTRDYTPSHVATGGYGEEFQRLSGGADRFFDFIEQELVPYLKREFRVAADDRTIVGSSYGGLAASYALLMRPSLFQRYIIVSPSLWWDHRLMLKIEEKQAKSLKDLNA